MAGKRRGGFSAQPSGQVLEPNPILSERLNLPDTPNPCVKQAQGTWPDLQHLSIPVCKVES